MEGFVATKTSVIDLNLRGMERATGIEPVSSAWKAEVLPLHNARDVFMQVFHLGYDVK